MGLRGDPVCQPLVLLVDTDRVYRERLAGALTDAVIQVRLAEQTEEEFRAARKLMPDLVLLGLGANDTHALQALGEGLGAVVLLMEEGCREEIFEQAAEVDIIAYLEKERCSPRVVAGFVQAHLAALGRASSSIPRCGDVALDPQDGVLRIGATESRLTPKQARIIEFLMQSPVGTWKPRKEILAHALGPQANDSALRKHINRLRKKIAREGLPVRIETAHAYGYRLVIELSDREIPSGRDV